MSGSPTAPQTQAPAPSTPDAPPAPLVLTPAATKRVRWLLVLSSLLLALWIAAMIAMYVKTVYPLRHPASGPIQNSAQ